MRISRSWSGEELLQKASSALSPASCSIKSDKQVYAAGETVVAQVRLGFSKQCEVEEGVIALRCVWGYEYRSDNMTHYTESGWNCAEKTILTGCRFQGGETVVEKFEGEIPVNSQPTGRGLEVQVRWEIFVHLKMSGVDVREGHDLIVLSSPVDRTGSQPQSASSECEDYDLRIDIDQPWVRPGEAITGTVTVIPHFDLKGSNIKLRLEYRERISSGSEFSWRPPKAMEKTLADRPELHAGTPKSYPFAAAVPNNACPSLETEDFSVRWGLAANVERRLRKDQKVQLPVQVRTAPTVARNFGSVNDDGGTT